MIWYIEHNVDTKCHNKSSHISWSLQFYSVSKSSVPGKRKDMEFGKYF